MILMKKTILIVGSGGREHALGWKIVQSPEAGTIYFSPGNGGTANLGENISIKADDVSGLLRFVIEKKIDLTIVGPEAPLALGIVDEFTKNGVKIFGPTKNATLLESSKAWAIRFMQENDITHPVSEIFTDYKSALSYTNSLEGRCVVKADGLTAGKGVFVCSNRQEAQEALVSLLVDKAFGKAGETVVVQEKLFGREVSMMAFCDGKVAIPIVPAQDHKRIFDTDRGPNTGGMGAFAPTPLTAPLFKKIHRLLTLTIKRMRELGTSYVGVLYAGCMIVDNKPYILEFNCRMGDPETQVQLPLLQSDLLPIIEACIAGTLKPEMVTFDKSCAVCVVLASAGYPDSSTKGIVIKGLEKLDTNKGLMVFHAGTKEDGGRIVTDGGRVLGVTARGNSVEEAAQKAYSVIGETVVFDGMQYRRDIAGYTHHT